MFFCQFLQFFKLCLNLVEYQGINHTDSNFSSNFPYFVTAVILGAGQGQLSLGWWMNRGHQIRYGNLKEIWFKIPTMHEKTRVPMHYVEIRDLFRRSIEKQHKRAVNYLSSTAYRIL